MRGRLATASRLETTRFVKEIVLILLVSHNNYVELFELFLHNNYVELSSELFFFVPVT